MVGIQENCKLQLIPAVQEARQLEQVKTQVSQQGEQAYTVHKVMQSYNKCTKWQGHEDRGSTDMNRSKTCGKYVKTTQEGRKVPCSQVYMLQV